SSPAARRRKWPGCPTRPTATSSATSSCCGCGTCSTASPTHWRCPTNRKSRSCWRAPWSWNVRAGRPAGRALPATARRGCPRRTRAVRPGKLPPRGARPLVRHEQQSELPLHAETLAVPGARLPAPEGDDDRARAEDRVSQLRHLLETLDLLYDAFGV